MEFAGSTAGDRRSITSDAKLAAMPLIAFLRMCEDLHDEIIVRRLRRCQEESLSRHYEQLGSHGVDTVSFGRAPERSKSAVSRPRQWWSKNKKDQDRRNELRAALVSLSEGQLKNLVVGVVVEMERRIPRLACLAEAARLVERARSDSTDELLRHKDLEKWVGAGL
ncbi:hypothetical protein LTR10_004979 [Elasticomyces elasticus]|nr:hypothetical protein LTR10_004979 [Elasticomyces elasticus]